MDLATPARHDDLVGISANPLEPGALPKRHSGTEIVARNFGENAYSVWDWHMPTPA
jgi:hypothetical protein